MNDCASKLAQEYLSQHLEEHLHEAKLQNLDIAKLRAEIAYRVQHEFLVIEQWGYITGYVCTGNEYRFCCDAPKMLNIDFVFIRKLYRSNPQYINQFIHAAEDYAAYINRYGTIINEIMYGFGLGDDYIKLLRQAKAMKRWGYTINNISVIRTL